MSSLERFLVAVLALVVLAVAGTLGVRWYGAHQFDAGHAAAEAEQRGRDLVATVGRIRENAVEATKQQSINLTITEAKNEELAPVRARIAAAPGVRVGPALCGGSAPAPEAPSAQGGNGADPPGRVVRSDVDRDIRALKLAVEEAFGAGRACQAWAVANGMAPPQPAADSPSHTSNAASSGAENVTPEK
jgi:hypothetical protein